MKKLIVANWKMNPSSAKEAVSLAKKVDAGIPQEKNIEIEVVIAPPFPFLAGVGKVIRRAKLGAQDVFWEDAGAYTGEVSPMILKRLGVTYVIIGHSEQRRLLHETDEMIHKKVSASLQAGLKAILCVGESLAVRKKGLAAAKNFVKNQLKKDLKNISGLKDNELIIAYEPIWAIGTGKSDNPESAAEMTRFIKSTLRSKPYTLNARVIYGGSVTSQNARSFLYYNGSTSFDAAQDKSLATEGIDGALVGGASLKAEEFKKIIKSL